MFTASITWNYSLTDNTGFLLQRSVNSGSTWTVNYPVTPASATSYLDTAISLGGTYWYRIAATNQYGTGSWSNTGSVFVPPIPLGPYNLIATSGSAILTWNSGSGFTDYYTLQKSTVGPFSSFAVSLIENYTDQDVTSSFTGNLYQYLVAAVGISGTSSFSNTASITFQRPPMPPQNLMVSSGSAALTWESGSNGSDLFHIQRSVNGVSYYDLDSTASLDYTDSGVTGSYEGAEYWYRVFASNAAGSSSYSNTSSILFGFPPPSPTMFGVFSGSALVEWTFNGSEALPQTAAIWKSTDGTNFDQIASTIFSNYTDENVTSSFVGTTYWYKVATFDPFGTSSFSDTASISFTWNPPPPSNVAVASGSAVVLWDYPDLGTPVQFKVQKSLNGSPFSTIVTTTNTDYHDNNVAANSGSGNEYSYNVYARVPVTNLTSSNSDTASIIFIHDPPFGSIEANVESGSALLSWTSSISNAASWDVYKSLNGGAFTYLTSTSPSIKYFRDENVTASFIGNVYDYEIVAVNNYGSSSFSNITSIGFYTNPPPPSLLPVVSGSAIITWISQSNGVEYFNVWKKVTNPGWFELVALVSFSGSTYEDTAVTCSIGGQTYWYAVDQVNLSGLTSSLSNTQSITFTCPVVPTVACSQAAFLPQYITSSLNTGSSYYPQPAPTNVADMVWNITTAGNTVATMSGGWGTFEMSSSAGLPTTLTMTSEISFPTSYMAETDARFDFYNNPAGSPNNYYIITVTYNETTSSTTGFGYPDWGNHYAFVQPLGGLITLPAGVNHVTCSVVLNSAVAESNITGSFAFFKWP